MKIIDLIIVEIMVNHDLVVEMLWHLKIMEFIEDYDINLYNLKLSKCAIDVPEIIF